MWSLLEVLLHQSLAFFVDRHHRHRHETSLNAGVTHISTSVPLPGFQTLQGMQLLDVFARYQTS